MQGEVGGAEQLGQVDVARGEPDAVAQRVGAGVPRLPVPGEGDDEGRLLGHPLEGVQQQLVPAVAAPAVPADRRDQCVPVPGAQRGPQPGAGVGRTGVDDTVRRHHQVVGGPAQAAVPLPLHLRDRDGARGEPSPRHDQRRAAQPVGAAGGVGG
ncbi:MAG: hypothetical protein AVDCRST_MAG66-3617, partial [uncultured Pseudonocardia sp.]